ncbi:MAG: RHS repeat protein [Firmicutes bacterium]|nr:RHS repeat protein [Bacillota bacterium]
MIKLLKKDECSLYLYNEQGRIREVRDGYNNQVAAYEYDALGRLTKDGDNEFGYDTQGNILYKKTTNRRGARGRRLGDQVVAYEYDEYNKLMSYDGQACGYVL